MDCPIARINEAMAATDCRSRELLMWSAVADGQISKGMIEKRDKQFGISSDELRERRKIYGYQVPSVDVPKSIDEVGRQWTSKGPDKPEMLK